MTGGWRREWRGGGITARNVGIRTINLSSPCPASAPLGNTTSFKTTLDPNQQERAEYTDIVAMSTSCRDYRKHRKTPLDTGTHGMSVAICGTANTWLVLRGHKVAACSLPFKGCLATQRLPLTVCDSCYLTPSQVRRGQACSG